ncbi:hypothetical protein BRC2024_KWYBBTRE_CDS_0198 [Acinetobacter phage vB_AbaM_AB-Navy-v2]
MSIIIIHSIEVYRYNYISSGINSKYTRIKGTNL